jgi:hypothetical protein
VPLDALQDALDALAREEHVLQRPRVGDEEREHLHGEQRGARQEMLDDRLVRQCPGRQPFHVLQAGLERRLVVTLRGHRAGHQPQALGHGQQPHRLAAGIGSGVPRRGGRFSARTRA